MVKIGVFLIFILFTILLFGGIPVSRSQTASISNPRISSATYDRPARGLSVEPYTVFEE